MAKRMIGCGTALGVFLFAVGLLGVWPLPSAGAQTGSSLTLEITAKDVARVGESLPYEMTVTNASGSQVTGVFISDRLPAGATYVDSSPGCSYSTYGYVTCVAGTMAPNERRTYTMTLRANSEGTLENLADARNDGGVPTPTVITKTLLEKKPSVSLTMAGDEEVMRVGETINYTLTVKNVLREGVKGVKVTDQVVTGMSYVSSDPNCAYSTWGYVTCDAGALAPDEQKAFDVRLRATKNGVATNRAEANNDVGSPTPTVVLETPVENKPLLDLTMAAAPDPVGWRETITYTLTVKNVVDEDVTGAWVSDRLPDGSTHVDSSPGCSYSPYGYVSCTVGTLTPGEDRTFEVKVRPNVDGPVRNDAQALSDHGVPYSIWEQTEQQPNYSKVPAFAGYTYPAPQDQSSATYLAFPNDRRNPVNLLFGSRYTDHGAEPVAENYRSVVGWDPGCLFYMDPDWIACPKQWSYVAERSSSAAGPDGKPIWGYAWTETTAQVVKDEWLEGSFDYSRRSHIRLWTVPIDLATGGPDADMYRAGRSAYSSAHHESYDWDTGTWHRIDWSYEEAEAEYSRQYVEKVPGATRRQEGYRNAAPGFPDGQYNDGVPTLVY